MTVAKMLALQEDVYTQVKAAVTGFNLSVFDHVPTNPSAEHIRIDGFAVADIDTKVGERARHEFQIHYFGHKDDLSGVSRGQKRAKQVLAAVHAQVMASEMQGATARHESLEVFPSQDGVSAEGMSRYTILLV